MINKEKLFSYKNIWHIAFPIILGSLAQDIITIVDTIFAGRLGEVALGAIALGGIFYLAIVMLGFGFGIGIQVLIARRHGENNILEIKKVWKHAFVMMLIIALILFIILKTFSPILIYEIVDSPLLHEGTISFLNIRLYGLFAAFANIVFRSLFIGIGNTKIISYTTILMAIINIVFDYLFMFGKFSFPELGIQGAAYASVIAEYVALLGFILFTIKVPDFKKYRFKIKSKLSSETIKNIFSISVPTMLQNFISFGAWFVFFIFVEKMGTKELAVSNIIRSMYIIMLLPIMGFASATNTLTSQSIGLNQASFIPSIIKRSISLCALGMASIIIVALIFPIEIISLFTIDEELVQATLPVFYVVVFASIFLAFGFILFSAVTGTGNTRTALLIESSIISLYLIGVSIIAKTNLRIEHVWMMEIFYGSTLGLISMMYLKYGKWQKKKI